MNVTTLPFNLDDCIQGKPLAYMLDNLRREPLSARFIQHYPDTRQILVAVKFPMLAFEYMRLCNYGVTCASLAMVLVPAAPRLQYQATINYTYEGCPLALSSGWHDDESSARIHVTMMGSNLCRRVVAVYAPVSFPLPESLWPKVTVETRKVPA